MFQIKQYNDFYLWTSVVPSPETSGQHQDQHFFCVHLLSNGHFGFESLMSL